MTNISPGWRNSNGGTMINPDDPDGQTHGLVDKVAAGAGYVASRNIGANLPYVVQPGSSVISTIGNNDYGSGADYAWELAAVLTVLDQAPPAGSFRPPYFGSAKPLYNKSQLNFDVFRDLAPTPNSVSPMELVGDRVKEVYLDLRGRGGANSSTQQKVGSAPRYGREVAKVHNQAALALNLDYTDQQKEALLIELVQRGIDVYGGLLEGYRWDADGGHRFGRKITLYIAGKALGAQEILERVDTDYYINDVWGSNNSSRKADYGRFQEDQQHFYIDQAAIDKHDAYGPSSLGKPAWKAQAFSARDGDEPGGWGNGYRSMNGSSNMGTVLILSLMGDRALWNHEAYFEYIIDQFEPWTRTGDQPADGTKNGVPLFTREMWNAYFGSIPDESGRVAAPLLSPAGGIFETSVNVSISSATAGAQIRYTTDGSNPSDTNGTLYGGSIPLPAGLTTLKAIAYKEGETSSTIRTSEYSVGLLAPPNFSPLAGSYFENQFVSLSSSSSGSSIHYTTDGSIPTTASAVFTPGVPIEVSSNTVIKAIVAKPGSESSSIAQASYRIGEISSADWSWSNIPLETPQSSRFSYFVSATPDNSISDSLVGLADGTVDWFTQLAAIVRFNPDGRVDAYDFDGYKAVNDFIYSAGKTYAINFNVDVASSSYSATISVDGGAPVSIAEGYRFRSPQASISSLSNVALWTNIGLETMYGGFELGSALLSPPEGLRRIDP
ncbi:chitobiase/beta-hexosaminidase C-terminal domain-containing protein [Haloferula sp.]|uniref:chitobiase/beta-hexosaminidase C-terminal domain-containing protein n=1 Tax=Haloferula sp. TaxID=2497595 RepID=UPI003C7830AE